MCVIAAAMGIASTSEARERVWFWGLAGFEEKSILTDDAVLDRRAELDTAAVLEGALRYENRYDRQRRWRLETNVRTEQFLNEDDYTNWRWRNRAEWRNFFDQDRNNEIRLRGEHEFRWRDGDEHSSRWRARGEFRHRHDEQHLSFLVAQFSNRDYNEDISTGNDHNRYLIEVGHEFTPHADRTRLRLRVGHEWTEADTDRKSSTGYYIDLHARHPVGPRTEIFGRGRIHWRDYEGPFDAPGNLLFREDERVRLTGGARYEFQENMWLVGEAGYGANNSNIVERDYSGFIFRVGIEVEWDIWRSED